MASQLTTEHDMTEIKVNKLNNIPPEERGKPGKFSDDKIQPYQRPSLDLTKPTDGHGLHGNEHSYRK